MIRLSMLSRSSSRLIAASTLSCVLVLNITPHSLAQFSPFSNPSNESKKVLGWNPNQAYVCGRLLCSNVFLPGAVYYDFTLARSINPGDIKEEGQVAIEDRANQIESAVFSLRDIILERKDIFEVDFNEDTLPSQRNRRWYLNRIFRQNDNTRDSDLHPDTPILNVGLENDQVVVFIPAQPEQGLARQTIVTVTRLDLINAGISLSSERVSYSQANSDSINVTSTLPSRSPNSPNTDTDARLQSEIEALAQKWSKLIRNNLSNALWEQEYDIQYPLDRIGLTVVLICTTVGLIWLINFFQQLFRTWQRRLKKRYQTIKQLLIQSRDIATTKFSLKRDEDDIENSKTEQKKDSSVASEQLKAFKKVPQSTLPIKQQKVTSIFIELLKRNPLGVIFDLDHMVVGQFQSLAQKVSFDEQSRNRQIRNLLEFLMRSFFWFQVTTLFTGITLITLIFPSTRLYSYFFISQAILLPIIWVLISLLDTVVNFLSDRYLHQWAKSAQLNNPLSSRYALRVNTYSPAIRGATTMLLVALGIYFTVLAVGINPSALASAGAVAVVVAFLSRNLLEDMLNGAMILWTDRYAIGDVIQVAQTIGFVENMNLYITQIRGAEGRLVTIPNGQIHIVENLTKDWSRVDFKIEIAYDADIAKALNTIEQVSEEMYQDPSWRDLILEPASILGVDAVSHAGSLLQIWIKTQPAQQFIVGREFRLRIKQAFDEADIALGVPQQRVIYHEQKEIQIH